LPGSVINPDRAYERQGLLDAGLTGAELDAIWLEGLTNDEIIHPSAGPIPGRGQSGSAAGCRSSPEGRTASPNDGRWLKQDVQIDRRS
jgi:hypothetical protein